MPIYEYTCERCHKTEEFLQKFGEKAPEICPHCHQKGTLKKDVTASSFHLKGGGWYKDLYASSKKDDSSTSTTKTTSSSDSSKDDKSPKPVKKDD